MLGGSGGMPPRKILKPDALRWNLGAFQGLSHGYDMWLLWNCLQPEKLVCAVKYIL